MTRTTRVIMLAVGGIALGALLTIAFLHLPAFGAAWHPYRDHAVVASLLHHTANAVSSVNFDQRGYDTFGEESLLFCAVVGIAAVLRPMHRERRRAPDDNRGQVMESTKLAVYLLFPLTILIGIDVIAHGAITPGGGFQGGVILATGIHLLYVGGRFRLLRRMRPLPWFEQGEAIGVILFAAIAIAGAAVAGHFFANWVPQGALSQLISSGTVPLFNVAVGLAVCGSIVVLLASFLDQALAIRAATPNRASRSTSGTRSGEGSAS